MLECLNIQIMYNKWFRKQQKIKLGNSLIIFVKLRLRITIYIYYMVFMRRTEKSAQYKHLRMLAAKG
jgi:hypothetical protein